MTCYNAVKVWESTLSIRFWPTADQDRTASDKGMEGGRRGVEEEEAEYKVIFLDAVKGEDMARKFMCQLDMVDYLITRCNELENELHRELK
jgi:hypothetical protein